MIIKIKQAVVIVVALQLILPNVAISGQAMEDKMMAVPLGVDKSEALKVLGKPSSVISKSLNEKGQTVELWQYDVVSGNNDPLTSFFGSIGIRPTAKDELAREKAQARQREASPPYIVTIVDDTVHSVSRKKANLPNATVRVE
jgi:hypothetical protein